ncbi:MAG: phosphomannose isomerase type II C-terminal cupin domain [Elusimicrobia bacterium]|nr:phosphomannose isomerase type II C-terminal cupin domain [Elusimicrobiota bacterium]
MAPSPHLDRRPWGTGQILHEGPGYKVKVLTVKPKNRTSLQYHSHRSETWTVLEGKARITLGKSSKTLKTFSLACGKTFFVAKKAIHRIHNPGSQILKILEVQWGKTLREDDIVRLADDYGRVPA